MLAPGYALHCLSVKITMLWLSSHGVLCIPPPGARWHHMLLHLTSCVSITPRSAQKQTGQVLFRMYQYKGISPKCHGNTWGYVRSTVTSSDNGTFWLDVGENASAFLDKHLKCRFIAKWFGPPSSSKWSLTGWDFPRITANAFRTIHRNVWKS